MISFSRGGGEDRLADFVFADKTSGNVSEEGAVGPDVDSDAIGMRCCEEFSRCGEGERGADAVDAHGIDEMSCWEIPDADYGVHGCGDDPSTVVREAEITDLTDAAPEFAD